MAATVHFRGWCALGRGVVVAAAVVLAGCGGGGGNGAADGSAAPPSDPVAGGVVVGSPILERPEGFEPAPAAVACGDANVAALTSRVLVSTLGRDDGGCGATPATACASIQQGIDRCAGNGCGVLVRHGLYTTTATLRLTNGVHVYGSCRFGSDPDRRYRTVVQAAPASGTPAVAALDVAYPTTVQGLVVVARDEAPSTASIAMTVTSSDGLRLRQSVLVAGRGGDGVAGATPKAPGGGDGAPSTNRSSGDGSSGGQACPARRTSLAGDGGSGGVGMRGDVRPLSCFGTCACTYPNLDDSVGRYGNSSGSVGGGANGARAYAGGSCAGGVSWNDFVGKDASAGSQGACSGSVATRSAQVWGTPTSAGGWAPGRGNDGSAGAVGSGGGGGSSGGYCLAMQSGQFPGIDHYIDGVPGGGGGGGGCGGDAGQGGGQGGASIVIVLRDSVGADFAQGNAFVAGPGGRGADGRPGGTGGEGGAGGAGGNGQFERYSDSLCPGPSGRGGRGGPGGAGSGGAGGNGGPSIVLAGIRRAPSNIDRAYPNVPGLGGAGAGGGAAANCRGATGEPGIGGAAGTVVLLDAPPDNVLAAGEALLPGQSKTSPNGAHRLTLQTDGNFCLYSNGAFRWCSLQSHQAIGVRVTMGVDGNLCLRRADDYGTWCTNSTVGYSGAYLAVRDEGSVVVQDGADVLVTLP